MEELMDKIIFLDNLDKNIICSLLFLFMFEFHDLSIHVFNIRTLNLSYVEIWAI
jgi:hypothetical protein